MMRLSNALAARIRNLEASIRPPQPEIRLILVWVDDEGQLTKVSDTHAHMPDHQPYKEDLSRLTTDASPRGIADEASTGDTDRP